LGRRPGGVPVRLKRVIYLFERTPKQSVRCTPYLIEIT
jgi:hypothetical protein